MRCRLAAFIAVLALGLAARAEVVEADAAGAAASESELAARALALDNERLSGEVARLQEQVTRLTVSLAEAMAELDLARAREEQSLAGEGGQADRGVRATEVSVLDVNPDLRLVVLSAGRQDGVVPGSVYAVIRGGRAVARLRIVDVRERISGASLDGEAGGLPQRGDRAVLAR